MEDVDFSRCPYHESLKEQLVNVAAGLNKRADKLEAHDTLTNTEIANIKERAAVMKEQTTMVFTILSEIKQQLKELTTAIRAIPNEQETKLNAKISELKEQREQDNEKWYESDMGKFAIKGGVIVVIMLAAAAIGQNALKDLIPLMGN